MPDVRPPLVLLHGVTNSARIWDGVAPLLADEYELIVPTAAGHRAGPPLSGRVSIASLVDDVERLLDNSGIPVAHLAGNSMGGWISIELARRGRALSVCALSPAGCWTPGAVDETHATTTIRRARIAARIAGPFAPLAFRSESVRRVALRDAAAHGGRVSPRQAVEIVRDLAACDAAPDLLGTREQLLPLDPLPCPVTLAWPARDRIFPPAQNGAMARALIPGAIYREMPDVGHVPMLDDPQLCAQVIRAAIREAD